MSKKSMSWNILFLAVFVGLYYLYLSRGPDWIWFLDDILHTMGGVIACSVSLWDSRKETMSLRTRFMLCIGFVALVSICWEAGWYYIRETTMGHSERYIILDDVMSDFLYALLGGTFRYVWYAVTTERI